MLTQYMQAEVKLIDAEATNAPWLEWQRHVVHAEFLKLSNAERATVLRARRSLEVWDAHCGGTAS